MNFGIWLENKLRELDRSNSWLAKKIHIVPSTLRRWTLGLNMPNLAIAYRIAKVLSIEEHKEISDVWLEILTVIEASKCS